MDFRLFLLALATFITGTAENIVIGILSGIAPSLDVSVGVAGQLTTVFSITFAITAPLALALTVRFERKAIMLGALALFIFSNMVAGISPSYPVLFLARIGMAAASAAVCLVATMLATELVSTDRRGRAIGTIFMGISGSMVLGVPAGMLIDQWFGWRAVFFSLAFAACIAILLGRRFLPAAGRRRGGTPSYIVHFKSYRLISAQLVSILMIGGHFVLFAYLTPYLAGAVGIASAYVFLAFVAFGLAGMPGGYCGGWLADKLTARTAIVLTPLLYLAILLAIPLAAGSAAAFIPIMMIWACISWMISPVVQSFLIAIDPDAAEAGISLNLSAMHIGVALGTAVGGIVLEYVSLQALPWMGCGLVALAVLSSLNATWRKTPLRQMQ
ncbi:MFS transporter [Ochrobactrum sp. CM-21-5]|nr:MFS transporter [Ochrobactrum sp. CM-21-5]MBC2885285.1 MFS transporter [Ochrobactrum sp. CM-21-5]